MKIEELEEDIITFFTERVKELTLPIELKFLYQAVTSQKVLLKLTKIPEQYKFATGCDILVQVNPEYFDAFDANDSKINEILFDQEVDNISFNMEKGTLKLSKPTFKSNKGIIDKYSYEEVSRAVEAEKLFVEQQLDKEKENNEQKKEQKNKKPFPNK